MLSKLRYQQAKPLNIDRFAKILSTSVVVPERVVTNDDIIKRYDLIATDRAVQFAIGINERRWADENILVSDLLAKAAQQCLDRASVNPEQLDRVIYTKLMGDQIVPATAIAVLKKLGIKRGIPAFDILAACSGFHFLSSYLYTDNTYFDYSYIPFGTELLNKTKKFDNEMFNMQMPDGMVVHNSVIDSCELVTNMLLSQNELTLDDIDIFITCDQTTMTWEAQLQRIKFPKEKSASLFHKYGNTVAAMSLINLHEMIESDRLKRGMMVIFMAHGAGASGGGFVFRY